MNERDELVLTLLAQISKLSAECARYKSLSKRQAKVITQLIRAGKRRGGEDGQAT
jgi:hypothetical protein